MYYTSYNCQDILEIRNVLYQLFCQGILFILSLYHCVRRVYDPGCTYTCLTCYCCTVLILKSFQCMHTQLDAVMLARIMFIFA